MIESDSHESNQTIRLSITEIVGMDLLNFLISYSKPIWGGGRCLKAPSEVSSRGSKEEIRGAPWEHNEKCMSLIAVGQYKVSSTGTWRRKRSA